MQSATPSNTSPAGSPAAAWSGGTVLLGAAQRQRDRVLSAAAAIRLGGAALLLAITLILWRMASATDTDWSTQVPTLIAYGVLALIMFMARGRSRMIRYAWVQPLLDVGFAYTVLRTSILLEPENAQSMAGLAVAVLLLPVALAGLAFRTRTLIVVTLGAALSNLSLMAQAGLSAWPTIAATAVMLLAASASKLAKESIEAEITRRLLAESRARCEELRGLQNEKDSLLNIIVHDMRTPVNTTLLSLEYLQEELRQHIAARSWQEAVAEALASSSTLADMIAQILDTTKLEARRMTLQLTVVDVCQLLDQARDRTLTHARSKNIALELNASIPLLATADPRLLSRALESLVTCAIRQTPNGGRILLQASANGGEGYIAVHRNGAPIPTDQQGSVFDKFPGTPGEARLAGWGLGLYFCRLMAEAHAAKLAVESTEDWPCSYVLRIPLLQTRLSPAQSEASASSVAPKRPPTPAEGILLSARRTAPSGPSQAALVELARSLAAVDSRFIPSTKATA